MKETEQPAYTIIKKPRANSKRGQIIEAATKSFCFYGYEGATMSIIANEAGVSKGIINKYFITKQNLFVLCLTRFIESFMKQIEESGENARDYREHAENLINLFQENMPSLRLLLSTMLTPNLEELVRTSMTQNFRQVVNMLDVNPAGWDGDCYELNYAVYSMLISFMIGGNEANYRRASGAVIDRFLPKASENPSEN